MYSLSNPAPNGVILMSERRCRERKHAILFAMNFDEFLRMPKIMSVFYNSRPFVGIRCYSVRYGSAWAKRNRSAFILRVSNEGWCEAFFVATSRNRMKNTNLASNIFRATGNRQIFCMALMESKMNEMLNRSHPSGSIRNHLTGVSNLLGEVTLPLRETVEERLASFKGVASSMAARGGHLAELAKIIFKEK
jgi:hypothetical protein